MPYGVATWDEKLYGCPKKSSHRVVHSSPVLASQGFYGEKVRTLVGRDRSSIIEVDIPQTVAQWVAFLDFYQNTLDQGQAWFTLVLRVPGGTETGVAHMDGFSVIPIGAGFSHGLLTASMEWYG